MTCRAGGGLGFDWKKWVSFARVVRAAGYATAIGPADEKVAGVEEMRER